MPSEQRFEPLDTNDSSEESYRKIQQHIENENRISLEREEKRSKLFEKLNELIGSKKGMKGDEKINIEEEIKRINIEIQNSTIII